ncbi:MAG: type II secretion system F family protein [Actinobacteria bacterium]|nr:type II secretion system F family protein [Actinomycetota bacterium]
MRQPLSFVLLLAWLGLTLLLGELRWFRRRPLIDRVRPYLFGLSLPSEVDESHVVVRVLGPLARDIGAAVARFSGVTEDLATRLERIHSPFDPTSFRLRQLGWVTAALSGAFLVAFAAHPPLPLFVLLVAGAPVLAFLIVESQLSHQSKDWKRSLVLELPVVSEQLGMLLSAGYSLGAALQRLSRRSGGVLARDLRRVVTRVAHGVDETTALREWATTADVPAVGRLVGILALNRDAGDLGSLITDEARAVRAEVHRDLVEIIEKRGQQVWIPVTVATLVPGLLFLAVPFTEALRLFTST